MAEDAGPALTAPQDGSTNATANDGINGGGAPLLMSSFFPSPPSFSASFTPENLKLAARLVAHADFKAQAEDWKAQQESILSELDVPAEEIKQVEELDLRTLVQPPDIDLFEEEGHWNAFGQTWPVKEALPTLEEMGVKQLYKSPNNFDDRRESLLSLLHTFLHTYLQLLSSLTTGPPSLPSEEALFKAAAAGQQPPPVTSSDLYIAHLRLCSINIHHLCNEWRPVQAREMLKLLMKSQIDERKQKTQELREKNERVRERLQNLKTRANGWGQDNGVADLSMETEKMELVGEEINGAEQAQESESIPEAQMKAQKRRQAAIDSIGE